MERVSRAWLIFSAAPHRLFFWMGSLYAVIAVAVWTLQQASLYSGLLRPIAWTLPFPWAHAFMMVYGLAGFYFFGFLLTTFPHWLNGDAVPKRTYVSAWLCLSAGAHGFWIGLFWHAGLSVAGCALMIIGFVLATSRLVSILLLSGNPERAQQAVICAGLILGIVGMAAAAWSFASGEGAGYSASRWIGLYGFLLLVIFTVIYRMIPFFTSMAMPVHELRRSRHAVPLFTGALLLRGTMGYLDFAGYFWVADGALFALLLREMIVWRFWLVRGPPLLTILYMAMGWFLLSFALSAGESLFVLLSEAQHAPFRNAALHAFTVGGFGSLLLGISTRVSLGHSGRGLITNRTIHGLFYGFQLVPLSRIIPDIVDYWRPELASQGFWSGGLWVIVFGIWFLGVGSILLRPRSDGRPG